MDIRYYFDSVDFSDFQLDSFGKNKNSLGYLIRKNMQNFSPEKFNQYDIAIVGVPYEERTENKGTATAPNQIRKFFYQLDNFDTQFKIIDLGNLKQGNGKKDIYYALRDVTDYLVEYGVTMVVIGGGQDIGIGIARAFKNEKFFTLTTIDPSIDLKSYQAPFNSSNYLSKILLENPQLFHINFLGYQSYYTSSKILAKVEKMLFDHIRLGDLRANIKEMEPIIRDSDFLSIDIEAIRQMDAPAHYKGSPNGLYSEEACQLARYAGLSDKLKVFGIFEMNPKHDVKGQTAKLASQIIWYFLEGFRDRKSDNPVNSSERYTQFNVQLEELDSPIIFYHNKFTERWWMQFHSGDKNKVSFSCSKNDYEMASKKEIPEKWLKFIRKIDQMSK